MSPHSYGNAFSPTSHTSYTLHIHLFLESLPLCQSLFDVLPFTFRFRGIYQTEPDSSANRVMNDDGNTNTMWQGTISDHGNLDVATDWNALACMLLGLG